jgi:hypothetical protein
MKKIFYICLLLFLLGCAKEDAPEKRDSVIWQPRPKAVVNDGKIKLNWVNPSIIDKVLLPYEIVNPDNFEIFISVDTPDNFEKSISLKYNEEYTYIVDNLENGKPCYFFVVAKKKGYTSLVSDTIMAIPNREPIYENLFNANNIHSVANVSISKKKNKIAYVDKAYRWNNGSDCCVSVAIVISNIDGSEPELLDKDCYEPYWSPINDQIVFRSEIGEINRNNGMPSQIAIYNYSTKTITKLTNDTIHNYSPVFSPNGQYILFQSDKNGTNIWMIDTKTLQTLQITDVAACHLNRADRPNWIDNERFVFQGTSNKNKTQIYESSVISKQIKQCINSYWNDYIPSASPDNSKIAFISDRSGQNQVWLYNLENKTFCQLTGFTDDIYVDVPWNRIEWLDDSTICYTVGDSKLVKQHIE